MIKQQLLAVAAIAASLAGYAQQIQRIEQVQIVHSQSAGDAAAAAPGVAVLSGNLSQSVAAHRTEPTVVSDAPYTAEAVTETTRILADGTRVVNKHVVSLARDRQGRTRREHSLALPGAWETSRQQGPRFATIVDPVAKQIVVLNLQEQTAYQAQMGEPLVYRFHKATSDGKRTETFEQRTFTQIEGAAPPMGLTVAAPAPHPMPGPIYVARFNSKNTQTENLGRQNMEGVLVEGVRATTTIAAGEIGNDRPIVSTLERWYSPELQMVIFSKSYDPQLGETIYRVTNLRRGDPDPQLFRIPPDFKLQQREAAAGEGDRLLVR